MNNSIEITSNNFMDTFPDLEILLISEDKQFHYVSGGIGPYYIDLRRGPNDPNVFKVIIDKYASLLCDRVYDNPLFIGVPTTGVIYASALALKYKTPLIVVEKLNPERFHTFSYETFISEIDAYSSMVYDIKTTAFLGLEDMGVIFATGLGIKHCKPSMILRRIQKGHGTSKTIEANLNILYEKGIRRLCVINDPYYPMTKDEVYTTLSSVPNTSLFEFELLNRDIPKELVIRDINEHHLIEIEDLCTTGTSAITLHNYIKKNTGLNADVIIFLDREQNAMKKFNKLKIRFESVYGITDIANYLFKTKKINNKSYKKVMNYVSEFTSRPSYSDLLLKHNSSSVCVGIDITPGKFPEKPEDTTLPNYPYACNAAGVKQYCLDLLDEISKVPEIGVIKPNLAYYNSFTDPELHSILQVIVDKAHDLNLLVILDTKIGDIMRTQAQYSEKYKHFDAVTAHGYMGSDSIFPITDVQLGCYVLVFTSNPSRIDFETLPLFDPKILDQYTTLLDSGMSVNEAKTVVANSCSKNYHKMVDNIIKWQYAGTIGAVVGGTPNKDGKLVELEEIVHRFAEKLDYLPPLLIPGVGTQGGSATDVINAILGVLDSLKWDEEKIRRELRKVSINSSSAIDYSPRPSDAARELVKEVQTAVDTFFEH